MRVLIAPDCFGGSLTAVEAARAIATGWRQGRPQDTLQLAPQSDGGPGFVEVLANRCDGLRRTAVSGPLNETVEATWVFDAVTSTAYLECAQACGLTLLGGPPTASTARDAHTRGVGQLIDAALAAGARRIVIGLGGSGSTDGGAAMIEALGGLAGAPDRLAGVEVIAATDVDHPLLGSHGAARVFGPQKGADPDTVEFLEGRLTDWAERIDAFAGAAISQQPGAGAAGGLGAGLLALGARRESGASIIAEHTGLATDIADADLVITGEGRFDDQSLHGKVVSALAREASRTRTPVLVLAGQVQVDPSALQAAGISAAHSVADHAGSVQRAIDDAAAQLTGLARQTAMSVRE